MPRSADSFARYRIPHAEAVWWGVGVQGGGVFRAPAGSVYPPAGHPSDHRFEWDQGRALGAHQIVFIAQGRGVFESQATGRLEIVAGTALVLFPGVWHRYRPDPATGWTEKWVEFAGALPQRLMKAGALTSERPVVAVARPEVFEARLDAIHAQLRDEPAGGEGQMAAETLGLLALLGERRTEPIEAKPVALAVGRAKRLFDEAEAEVPALPELARSLGVAYSSFRREFRARTGLSPQQYQLRMRLQRVQRLLGSTDRPIKEIADALGFSSPYHLSTAFTAQFGIPPSEWRKRLRQEGVS